MAHKSAMERFAQAGRGAAVLAHHHEGELAEGRERADASNQWIIFAGGAWISAASRQLAEQPDDLRFASDFDPRAAPFASG